MTEKLLQYIWQFQYFNTNNLFTQEGESLIIIHPGILNTNQGPDFSDARIKINNTIWAGSVELHINSSDWKNHKHNDDLHYKKVILHVVWKNDSSLQLPFSTLILEDKVPKLLLHKYSQLMNTTSFIPCSKSISTIDNLTWQNWKERVLVERLQQKYIVILEYQKQNNNHWQETFWWMIAKNYGNKQNNTAFEKIAQSIPINLLAKHKDQLHQIEALLFGQAGLLVGKFNEDYPKQLQNEYAFLQQKYKLPKVEARLEFHRMRPSNFPTLRLAQLAMLVHQSMHLFSKIIESFELKTVYELLKVSASEYWNTHYVFDKAAVSKKKALGSNMIENILINTIIPNLFAYGNFYGEEPYKERAMAWMEELKPEKNVITNGFENLGIINKNAFDSQSLIQLKNNYCTKKRCLECSVGNKLLRNN